ncbi:MAG: ThiF family adenylyltransferase [Bacteroidales bacterium]|nr:ThiF family adenylyltransferase [Bacteroidales bacterium]
MLLAQINRSRDLKQLIDDGFEIEVKGGHLIVHHIPYVNSSRQIKYGKFISTLALNNDVTMKPDTHVMGFMGEQPCNKDGSIITAIQHSSPNQQIADGIVMNFTFSNKPQNGYDNYYHKVTQYAKIIATPAQSLDNTVIIQTFKVLECSKEESVFLYTDSNSSRANINQLTEKFKGQRIGIVGLGGTGSYVLDFVAKTPVDEVLLFDSDEFLQHNAFRSPGAVSVETLNKRMKKVDYYASIYSQMRRGINVFSKKITEANIDLLEKLSYVFICIDDNRARSIIISKLKEFGVSFIDVGLGVNVADENLVGTLRVTIGTPEKHDHIPNRIGAAETDGNEYATNIQIADLNALNALMAVIKWKKMCGFYQDLKKEHNSTFVINTGQLIHEDYTV